MLSSHPRRIDGDAERRFHRAWDGDGLPDLVAGLYLAILGALTLGEQRLLRSLFGFAFVFGGQWLVGKAKRRISDGRTGYVRPRRLRGKEWALAAALGTLGAYAFLLVALYAAFVDWPMRTATSLLLFVVAALPLIGWFLTASRRYIVLMLVSLAAAAAAWRMGDGEDRLGLYALLFGAAMLVSGALTLRGYLLRNPTPRAP